MKTVLLCSAAYFFLFPSQSFSQGAVKDMLIQKWKYIGVEEFSVVHPPDSTMKNDWVSFSSDGKYQWFKQTKLSSGTWKLNEAAKIISFTDDAAKKTLSYNLKNITSTDLTLEYQTPDLVRTRYRYVAIKE